MAYEGKSKYDFPGAAEILWQINDRYGRVYKCYLNFTKPLRCGVFFLREDNDCISSYCRYNVLSDVLF
jgi:hypothetical protein